MTKKEMKEKSKIGEVLFTYKDKPNLKVIYYPFPNRLICFDYQIKHKPPKKLYELNLDDRTFKTENPIKFENLNELANLVNIVVSQLEPMLKLTPLFKK